MKEKISVIVPIYKVEKYLDKCINSIVCQTYENIEIILVDDGSPDKCPEICDEYKKQDQRIIVIHKENGGLSDARNVGIDIATGKYFIFVDSDDFLELNMIELLYMRMQKDNSDMVACNYNILDENYKFLSEKKILNKDETTLKTGIQSLADIYSKPNAFDVVAWNKLYKAYLFENIRYPKGKIHEDAFIIHYLLYKCQKVSIVEYALYNYISRNDSITGNASRYQRFDSIESRIDRLDFYLKKELKVNYQPVFFSLITLYSSLYCKMDNSEYKEIGFTTIKEKMSSYYTQIKKELDLITKFNYFILKVNPKIIYQKNNFIFTVKKFIKKVICSTQFIN
ncbi:MAG: glycosyltransferase family 2 protein [Clostridia bacterium]